MTYGLYIIIAVLCLLIFQQTLVETCREDRQTMVRTMALDLVLLLVVCFRCKVLVTRRKLLVISRHKLLVISIRSTDMLATQILRQTYTMPALLPTQHRSAESVIINSWISDYKTPLK